MAPGQRVFKVVPDVLIKLLILLVLDLGTGTRPERAGTVDRLPLGLGGLVVLLTVDLFR